MRIFPPAIELAEDEGFTPSKDLFKRKSLGDGLISLLGSVDNSLVVAVDGPWGCGKTTFLRMWAGELRKAGFPVIFFDAFEHDYFDDPFMAIASEIIALAQKHKSLGVGPRDRLLDKAKGVGRVLLRSGLKVGASLATAGLVQYELAEKAAKEIASEASAITDKYLGEILTKATEQKDAIAEFKSALSELPTLLTGEDIEQRRPLVLIVDELDRCRPSFALQVLERIKHFFSSENVHFVLGVHMGQLRHSANLTYGPNLDATLYLQKFIHIIVPLMDTAQDERQRASRKFIAHLFRDLQLGINTQEISSMADLLADVADRRQLSFRTIERIVAVFALALATSRNTLRVPPILIGLCILKVVDPDLYLKAKSKCLTYVELRAALLLSSEDESWETRWWRFCLDPDLDEETTRGLYRAMQYSRRDRFDVVPFTANEVIDKFEFET